MLGNIGLIDVQLLWGVLCFSMEIIFLGHLLGGLSGTVILYEVDFKYCKM